MTTDMPDRFTTSDIGRYGLEYDRETNVLRLSDSGWQTFATLEEARGIQAFLRQVLPGTWTPEQIYKHPDLHERFLRHIQRVQNLSEQALAER
jgi:hypothetical protein